MVFVIFLKQFTNNNIILSLVLLKKLNLLVRFFNYSQALANVIFHNVIFHNVMTLVLQKKFHNVILITLWKVFF